MNITTQTRKIYNNLCDDVSKNIFENRLLYSLTGNYNFINNVLSTTFEEPILKGYKDTLNSYFEKYNNNDIIVYGAGFFGEQFIILCDKVKVAAFCDSNTKRQGTTHMGYKILSPAQLKQDYSNAVVIITVLDEKAVAEITENLLHLGVKKECIVNLMHIYKLHNFSAYHLQEAQYFVPDIILPRLSKDEIFIDGGCCNCYTDILFAKYRKNEYKKIIAFEPNPEQYPICVEKAKSIKNITIHPYGLWNENTELSFDNSDVPGAAHISDDTKGNALKIKTIKLDDILDGEGATFIKLDVEGAELNALKGAEQTIRKYRPKLAVCIYHKLEDVWEIPEYLLSLHDDYQLYIRHHGFWGGETVLYAV